VDRKRKLAIEKVADPMAAAQRKKRKTEGKVASRKRKVDDYKEVEGRKRSRR
jgi:hypothetical protein